MRKEALAAIKLTHPHIVRLHSYEVDDDVVYLVMEYLNGQNLEEASAEEETLPPEEVKRLARYVCPALDYAHKHGVIHRDIKPANLQYHREANEWVVKITDLGIAYVIKDSMTRLTGLESAGTLLYIAPEQLQGQKPDARSDQYALAASLYELLAGDPPFCGAGLSHQIIHASPRGIEEIPDGMNCALLKALSKEPEERFPDCQSFLAALEGVKEEPKAPPPSLAKAKAEGGDWFSKSSSVLLLLAIGIPILLFSLFYGEREGSSRQNSKESKRVVSISASNEGKSSLETSSSAESETVSKKRERRVHFSSRPPGAKVFSFAPIKGDKKVTNTPGSVNLAPGSYKFKFVLLGHKHYIVDVSIPEQGKVDAIEAELEKQDGFEPKREDEQALVKKARTIEKEGYPKEGADFINELGMRFQWVPSGTLLMELRKPTEPELVASRRDVRVERGFWIAQREVSNGSYVKLKGESPSPVKGAEMPVQAIALPDVLDFCKALTEHERARGRLAEKQRYSLPTEAQWEYAARAGSKALRPSIDGLSCKENSGGRLRPIAQGEQNSLGLYDMMGNLREWTLDDWYEDYSKGPRIGRIPWKSREELSFVVQRGASYAFPYEACLYSLRIRALPYEAKADVGFRPVIVSIE